MNSLLRGHNGFHPLISILPKIIIPLSHRNKNIESDKDKGDFNMKLMTEELQQQIPLLYATEEIPLDKKMVYAKFFTPDASWSWYVSEYNPNERLCFGYVIGHEREWGYFSLDELESVRGSLGLKIERDIHFEPITYAELKKILQ